MLLQKFVNKVEGRALFFVNAKKMLKSVEKNLNAYRVNPWTKISKSIPWSIWKHNFPVGNLAPRMAERWEDMPRTACGVGKESVNHFI